MAWRNFVAAGGRDKVRDDMDKIKMTVRERAKMSFVMEQCAAGALTPPVIKPLSGTDGLWEIRFRQGARSFRLAYATVEQGHVLLAVHLFVKQRQAEQDHVRLAADRLRQWRSGR